MTKRLFKLFALFCIFFISLSIIYITIFKFLPLPASSFLIQNRILNFISGNDSRVDYDWISIDDMSDNIKLAVIASEDQKFLYHFGFDLSEIQKVYDDYQKGRKLRGASTITQQTAKNLFLWKGKDFIRKGMEAYFTILIELIWSKERILEVYLNIAEFGENIYGVGSASRILFKKEPHNLSKTDASLLAAVLPNPKKYKADSPSRYVSQRAQWIRTQMNQLGIATLKEL